MPLKKKKQTLISDSMREYMEGGEACRQGVIAGLQDTPIWPSLVLEPLNASVITTGTIDASTYFNRFAPEYKEPKVRCGCARCGQFPDFEQEYEPKYLRMTLGCNCYKRTQIKDYSEFVLSKLSGEHLCHEMKVELYNYWNEWAEIQNGKQPDFPRK